MPWALGANTGAANAGALPELASLLYATHPYFMRMLSAPVVHISSEDEAINPSMVNGYRNVMKSWISTTQSVHTTGIKW